MKFNPNIHHRRSIRLKGYDYSQAGLYFITICCQNMAHLFGRIVNDEMELNDAGKMVEEQWLALTERFTNIALHEFIVMPNHFHSILEIVQAPLLSEQNKGHNIASGIAGLPLVGSQDLKLNIANEIVRAPLVGAQNKEQPPETSQNDKSTQQGQPQGIAPTDSTTTPLTMPPLTIPKNKTIGDMMDAYKSITTVEYIRGVKNLGWQPFNKKVWQRDYYEHIIRDERAYINISNYIINNPANWKGDKFYK